jgi:pSer/pThr/pTyr-binding forkhead associated (FHA) protein
MLPALDETTEVTSTVAAAMSLNFVLVGLPPADSIARIVPSGRAGVLGRSTHCDLVVDDLSVSRRHDGLLACGPHLVVTDLGSTNGTFVGDRRVRRAAVAVGGTVRFGDVPFLAGVLDDQVGEVDSRTKTDPTGRGARLGIATHPAGRLSLA